MKNLRFALIVLLLPVIQANAESVTLSGLCSPAEVTYFSCPVKKEKWISVCGAKENTALQYRFGTTKTTEWTLPRSPSDSISYNYLMYSGGGGAYIRFSSPGTDYIVFSKTVRGTGESSGVLILSKNKKPVQVKCVKNADLKAPVLEKLKLKQEDAGIDPFMDINE